MPLPEHLQDPQRVFQPTPSETSALAPTPEIEAIRVRLQLAGFGDLRVAKWPDWSGLDVDATRVLSAAGMLIAVDPETGVYPNEHDGVLYELAAAAGADLAGVVFEEVAPEEPDPDADTGYVLHAYADGKRWTVETPDFRDWYDFDAMLQLGNAVLCGRGSDKRMQLLRAPDYAEIVVAPRLALGAAFRLGLLHSGDNETAAEFVYAYDQQQAAKQREQDAAGE